MELSRHMKPMRAGGNAVSALHIGDPELDSVASLLLRGIGNCARPVRSRAVTRPKTFHAKAPDLPGVLPLCSHRRRQVGHCNPPTKSGICLNRHPELQFRWFPPDAQGRHRSRIGGGPIGGTERNGNRLYRQPQSCVVTVSGPGIPGPFRRHPFPPRRVGWCREHCKGRPGP